MYKIRERMKERLFESDQGQENSDQAKSLFSDSFIHEFSDLMSVSQVDRVQMRGPNVHA